MNHTELRRTTEAAFPFPTYRSGMSDAERSAYWAAQGAATRARADAYAAATLSPETYARLDAVVDAALSAHRAHGPITKSSLRALTVEQLDAITSWRVEEHLRGVVREAVAVPAHPGLVPARPGLGAHVFKRFERMRLKGA